MTMSSIILTINRTLKSDVVWFIQTIQQNEKRENNEELPAVHSLIFDRLLPVDRQICRHQDSCDSHVYKVIHYAQIPIQIKKPLICTGRHKQSETWLSYRGGSFSA